MSHVKQQKYIEELEEKLSWTDKTLHELSVLTELSNAISSLMDIDKIIEMILKESSDQIDAAHSSIMLLREDTPDVFTTLARQEKVKKMSTLDKSCRSIAGWVLKHKQHLLVDSILEDFRFNGLKMIDNRLQSVLAFPMKTKDKIVGVMVFQNLSGDKVFTEENLRIISIIAAQSAQVLENARLFNLLTESNLKLEEYNRTLEQKVKERTQELEYKNEKLEQILKELKETQNQLIMQEKMASLGNLVAGLAHEMNSPIGAANSAANVVSRSIEKINDILEADDIFNKLRQDQKFQQMFQLLIKSSDVILDASQRVSRIVKSLRKFACLDEADLQTADIHEGIESALTLINHLLKAKVLVIKEYGNIPQINCYPGELNQVFMNILMNATQAIEVKGIIKIETYSQSDKIYIKISDTGKGIPAEYLNKVFDPGFTKKGVNVGIGLGLSISYNIIQKHKGDIFVESEVGKGTTFTIAIPQNIGCE